MNNKVIASAMVLIFSFLAGCATTNFSKSVSPVTVREQWIREALTVWGGPKVFSIGNVVMGYGRESGSTYTVDPGPTVMQVYYYANRGGFGGVFTQTNLVEIPVVLDPNGHYEVRAIAGETSVVFSVISLGMKREIATTPAIPIIVGASPLNR